MALINLFVKLWNNLVSVCNNGKRVVIKLLRTILNVISNILHVNLFINVYLGFCLCFSRH